jgi:hypothetical protein
MKTIQVKTEIQRLLDTVPDNILQELLEFLKQAQAQNKDKSALSNHLKKILQEDRELLEKLAL